MKTKIYLLLGCLVGTLQFATAAETDSNAASSDDNGFAGKVLETTNASGYTYVLVDTGSAKHWAATTEFPVKVGDGVKVGKSTPMGSYHSKSLNRDFDDMYFAGQILVSGADAVASTPALPPGHPALSGAGNPALPPGHPSLTAPATKPNLDLTGIKKADGGKTVAEIYAAKTKLTGKPVVVRGKVVKYNAMILGKNWLHIQDGSGSADNGDNDLTITTSTPAKLGDVVLVNGNLATDRDFGAGYKYGVIIEDAKVTVE